MDNFDSLFQDLGFQNKNLIGVEDSPLKKTNYKQSILLKGDEQLLSSQQQMQMKVEMLTEEKQEQQDIQQELDNQEQHSSQQLQSPLQQLLQSQQQQQLMHSQQQRQQNKSSYRESREQQKEKKKEEIICSVLLDVGQEQLNKIDIRADDNIQDIALAFCQQNDLHIEAKQLIIQEIQQQLQAHNTNNNNNNTLSNSNNNTLSNNNNNPLSNSNNYALSNSNNYASPNMQSPQPNPNNNPNLDSNSQIFYSMVQQLDLDNNSDDNDNNYNSQYHSNNNSVAKHNYNNNSANKSNYESYNNSNNHSRNKQSQMTFEQRNQNNTLASDLTQQIKGSKNYGEYLYLKSKTKMHQKEQIKQMQDKQREQKSLENNKNMFKPALNQNSLKIAEKKKQQGQLGKGLVNNKQLIQKQLQQQAEEEECTFNPCINPHSRQLRQQVEQEHPQDKFHSLYLDHQRRTLHLQQLQQQQQQDSQTFHPTLNKHSLSYMQKDTRTFQQRVNDYQQVKQEKLVATQQALHPKHSTSPIQYNVGDMLYNKGQLSTRRKQAMQQQHHQQLKRDTTFVASNKSQLITLSRRVQQIYRLFQLLDGDQDGFISNNKITIESLSSDVLAVLNPIFQEIELMDNVEINYEFFEERLLYYFSHQFNNLDSTILMNFHKQNNNKDKECTFKPTLNEKSLTMINNKKKQQKVFHNFQ